MRVSKINVYVKASIFYMVGNGLGQGIILLSTIVFTRIMSQNDYGVYTTYYSIVSILNTLVGANLFNGLNNAYVDYKKEIHKYRASNLLLSTFVFLCISFVVFIINAFVQGSYSNFMIIMALIHAYGFFVINYYNYSANMENKFKIKTTLMILPNVFQVVLSILFIIYFPISGLNSRIVGSVLGISICAIFSYVSIIKGQRKLVNFEYWMYGLKISVPSILSSISYMLMSQCDNIMITAFYGANETAVYGMIYNIGYILYAVMQATNGVLQAWLYKVLDTNNLSNVKIIQKWYLYLFGIMAFGLFMISPEIIKLLGPETYWNFKYVAPFILGSCLMVMYSFYTVEALFYKKTGKVSICVFCAAIINIILNYILIPFFGGVAAAITSVIAYMVLFILLRGLGQKLHKNLYSDKYFMTFFISVLLGCILFEFVYMRFFVRYGIYLSILLLSFVYLYIKRAEWGKILNREKKINENSGYYN